MEEGRRSKSPPPRTTPLRRRLVAPFLAAIGHNPSGFFFENWRYPVLMTISDPQDRVLTLTDPHAPAKT